MSYSKLQPAGWSFGFRPRNASSWRCPPIGCGDVDIGLGRTEAFVKILERGDQPTLQPQLHSNAMTLATQTGFLARENLVNQLG